MAVDSITAAIARAQEEVERAKREVEAQAAQEKSTREAAADDAKATAEAQQKALAASERLQAMVDVSFLVAAADGRISDGEQEKVVASLRRFTRDALDDAHLRTMLKTSQGRRDLEGVDGLAGRAAKLFSDADTRRALLMVAAAGAWLDGGVGTKEGLALQGISKAFDIPIGDMHKILGQAKG